MVGGKLDESVAQRSSRSSRAGVYEVDLSASDTQSIATIELEGKNPNQLLQYAVTLRKNDSAESVRGADEETLAAIAASGGGAWSRDPAIIAAACRPPAPTVSTRATSLEAYLAGSAVLAWILDVAARKWLARA